MANMVTVSVCECGADMREDHSRKVLVCDKCILETDPHTVMVRTRELPMPRNGPSWMDHYSDQSAAERKLMSERITLDGIWRHVRKYGSLPANFDALMASIS